MPSPSGKDWALILGSSSGFGAACAIEFASLGMHIFGVHLDRKNTLSNVEQVIQAVQQSQRKAVFFNANAADQEKRREIINTIAETLRSSEPEARVRVFLHSLAFGTLRPFIGKTPGGALTPSQMDMTLDVMANSLVYWTQDLVSAGLMGPGGRIYAMTSAGGSKVWPGYGAVSAAKGAIECHIRQLALELADRGITANAIMAGVTDTPALRKIPGSDAMISHALQRNPSRRLTTPQDVASVISVLAHPKTQWMTGNVIAVDGGEFIVG